MPANTPDMLLLAPKEMPVKINIAPPYLPTISTFTWKTVSLCVPVYLQKALQSLFLIPPAVL